MDGSPLYRYRYGVLEISARVTGLLGGCYWPFSEGFDLPKQDIQAAASGKSSHSELTASSDPQLPLLRRLVLNLSVVLGALLRHPLKRTASYPK